MPLNNDDPFGFEERAIDPAGRVIRQIPAASPAPRRRRRADAEPQSLDELLRASIREIVEREIRKVTTESELSELLRAMLESVERRGKKGGK